LLPVEPYNYLESLQNYYQGYQIFRLDKNRHDGGIIMYVYILERYAVIISDNVEIFTVTVNNGCCKACHIFFLTGGAKSVCFCGSLCPHQSHIVTSYTILSLLWSTWRLLQILL